MKELLKKQNGITLIALVITIIVLLILAGVSIAMLTGENGIIGRANDAVELTKYKTAEEKVNLAVIGAMVDDGEMNVDELKTEVEHQGGTVSGTTFPVQVQMDGYTFMIESSGKVIEKQEGDQEDNKEVFGEMVVLYSDTGLEASWHICPNVLKTSSNSIIYKCFRDGELIYEGEQDVINTNLWGNYIVEAYEANELIARKTFQIKQFEFIAGEGVVYVNTRSLKMTDVLDSNGNPVKFSEGILDLKDYAEAIEDTIILYQENVFAEIFEEEGITGIDIKELKASFLSEAILGDNNENLEWPITIGYFAEGVIDMNVQVLAYNENSKKWKVIPSYLRENSRIEVRIDEPISKLFICAY